MNLHSSHVFFLFGNLLYIGIRSTYQFRGARITKPIRRTTWLDRFLIFCIATAQIGFPSLLLFTSVLNWANYSIPIPFAWLGGALMIGGLVLFWRSHADLGDHWSVTLELKESHRLIKEGVYRHLRHPMYAAFFLLAFGQGLLLNNWIAGWAALFATTLLYIFRLPKEEEMMIEYFGEEYVAYRKETMGLIPRYSLLGFKRD